MDWKIIPDAGCRIRDLTLSGGIFSMLFDAAHSSTRFELRQNKAI